MNRTLLALLLGAALAPLSAHAQGYTFQVGAVQPTDRATRDATQDAGLAVGVGLLVPSQGANGAYSIDGFYTRAAGNGNTLQSVGAYLIQRLPLQAGSGLYYGAGAGIAQTRFKGAVAQEGTTPTSASVNKTGLSYRMVAGMKLMGGITAELGYTINPSVNFGSSKVKTNTLTLTVGKAY